MLENTFFSRKIGPGKSQQQLIEASVQWCVQVFTNFQNTDKCSEWLNKGGTTHLLTFNQNLPICLFALHCSPILGLSFLYFRPISILDLYLDSRLISTWNCTYDFRKYRKEWILTSFKGAKYLTLWVYRNSIKECNTMSLQPHCAELWGVILTAVVGKEKTLNKNWKGTLKFWGMEFHFVFF